MIVIGTTNAEFGGLGFYIHPSFVVDSQTLMLYGFSDVKVWNRPHEKPTKGKSHKKKLLPIEQKESYKWIASSLKSKEVLSSAQEIIIVQDREGDLYGQFCVVPDSRTHLLIRAKSNRILHEKTKLFDYLSSQPEQGSYQVELEGDKRRNIKKRIATVAVRFVKVTISANQYTSKSFPRVSLFTLLKLKRLVRVSRTQYTGGCSLPKLWMIYKQLYSA